MNKEEILNKYIDLIDKGYCCDCNELNCIDNFPHAKITHAIRELQQQNKKYKEVIGKAIKCIDYNTKYRNGADIYQFVDIESEILEPLKFILELDEENGNAYLKEFNDWLKEVE